MRQRPLCIVFLFLMIFIALGSFFGLNLWNSPSTELREYAEEISGSTCIIYGEISSREEKTNTISYFLKNAYLIEGTTFTELDLDSIQNTYITSLHNIRVYSTEEIKIGSRVALYGEIYVYEAAHNPGGFDSAAYYAADDCCMYMYASNYKIISEGGFSAGELFAQIKAQLKSGLSENMSEEGEAILSAMLLGDKSELTSEIKLDYCAAGLSHLLAISGMHVLLIGSLIYTALLKLRCKLALASAASVILILTYCIFTGGRESALRAGIMFAIMHVGRRTLKSYDALSAISLTGIIILLIRPMALFRAGFQLSFAAAAGITLIYPAISIMERLTKRPVFKKLLSYFAVWLSVNLATFPIILYYYYELPLYSLITNMIFVPLMGVVLILGLFGMLAGIALPAMARILLFIPDIFLNLQNTIGKFIMKLPYSLIIIGQPVWWQLALYVCGTVLLIVFLKQLQKEKKFAKGVRIFLAAAAAAGIICCAVHLPEGFSITALDVGQGDSLVIRNKNTVYIVDGGSSSESSVGQYTIIPYLKASKIRCIEGIFLTHNDSDHYNGISELLLSVAENETAIRINYLFMPSWMKDTDEGRSFEELAGEANIRVIYLNSGDSIAYEKMNICVLAPDEEDKLSENEGSLILSVEYEGFKALLTGDLEGEGEDKLLGKLGSYDYLKVMHHGSKNSGSDEFYEVVSPTICIISAPKNSVYGHPHEETINRIEAAGASWYQTGLAGAIKVTVKNAKMLVDCYLN